MHYFYYPMQFSISEINLCCIQKTATVNYLTFYVFVPEEENGAYGSINLLFCTMMINSFTNYSAMVLAL